jgi:serine/threonine-protein kinase RsbW
MAPPDRHDPVVGVEGHRRGADAAGARCHGTTEAPPMPAPRVHHRALAHLHGCTATQDISRGTGNDLGEPWHPDLVFCALATPHGIRHVLDRICTKLLACGVAQEACGRFELLTAEAMNNIAEHAYAGVCSPGWITLEVHLHRACIVGRLTDGGRPMPGCALPVGHGAPPAGEMAVAAIADLPEGGFGLHLMQALARDLRYVRRGDYNALTFALDMAEADARMAIGA